MTTRPNAKPWTILEQIIEDPVSGLALQFEVSNGKPVLRIYIQGEPIVTHRDIFFAPGGDCEGAGSQVSGCTKPAWPTKIEDLGDPP